MEVRDRDLGRRNEEQIVDLALTAGEILDLDGGEPEARAMLFELEGTGGPEYWVGFNNFYVITRYNRSVMYALAVYQLGQEIALAVRGDAS